METLRDVGLGYIRLGQPATTLSGGEAQRIKLASELSRRSTGQTFYILDEPTTGLSFDDANKLMQVLHRLVDSDNTVTLIEHHLDLIKNADWLIDLGPFAGDRGGEIVAQGTPEFVASVKESSTGQYLSQVPGIKADPKARGANGGEKTPPRKKRSGSNTATVDEGVLPERPEELSNGKSNGRNGRSRWRDRRRRRGAAAGH
jgi:excinuclease ABC subunit A